MSRKTTLRAILNYSFFTIASNVLGFLASYTLIRMIGPNQLGEFSIFTSLAFLVVPLLTLGSENLIAVNKSSMNQESYNKFIDSYKATAFLIYILFQTLVIFFVWKSESSFMYLLLPIMAIIKALININLLEYVIENKYKSYGLYQLCSSGGSLILTLALLNIFEPYAIYRVIAIIFIDVLYLYIFSNHNKIIPNIGLLNKIELSKMSKFGVPMLLALFPSWVLNDFDKWYVLKKFGIDDVGIYTAAATLASFMVAINGVLINSFISKLFFKLQSDNIKIKKVLIENIINYLIIYIIALIIFIYIYKIFSIYLLPEKYIKGESLVYIISFFSISRAFYAIPGAIIDYFKLTSEKFYAIVCASCISALSIYYGVDKFGLIGAAIGVGVGYLVLGTILITILINKRNVI
jgi:O-antigen/teichoic acid export membrane protein